MTLFICNTAYQVFNAINMSLQLHSGEEVDIIISNHTNLEKVVHNLEKTKIFRNIWTSESLTLARKFFFFDDNKKYNALMDPEKYLKECLDINYLVYDMIYTANVDGYINLLYRYHVLNNTGCEFNYYEDGWSTYTNNWSEFAYSPYEKYFYEMLGEKIFQKAISKIYVYEPRLGCFPELFSYMSLPKINKKDKRLKDVINIAFNYYNTNEYDRPFIFLEEAFVQDGYENNDLKLVDEIGKVVGFNQMLVKRHPRLQKNRFENTKISVNKDFDIPWEVHILNNNFSDKILFTVTSGAVLTPRLVFNEISYSVYLRDLLSGTVSRIYKTKEFKLFISKYRRLYPNELFIPKTINGIKICIKSVQGEFQKKEYVFNIHDAEILE